MLRCMLGHMLGKLRAAALAASVVFAGCASAAVSFDNATPGAALRITAEEYRPGGGGAFPAVVPR